MSVHYDLPNRIQYDLALMAEKYNIQKLFCLAPVLVVKRMSFEYIKSEK